MKKRGREAMNKSTIRSTMDEAVAQAARTHENTVQAGGGVLYRFTNGELEVAITHRERYKDWSFPKGKARKNEAPETAALREVEEETGYRCLIECIIGATSYELEDKRIKMVWYWLMRPLSGTFVANSEVDELRWVPVKEAKELLTYEHDREMLKRVDQLLTRWRP